MSIPTCNVGAARAIWLRSLALRDASVSLLSAVTLTGTFCRLSLRRDDDFARNSFVLREGDRRARHP
ncbi:hypothetical protein [Sphingobium sp. KCTC 72723]|uniref:hypothetical protein n=1 Tax=Sphingobium sp. KCTC 72723 TaxID=2733867 RepID=UPI00165DF927|nr:hypothetical protein [Sphingobium sp. KCTC 72723]